MRAHICNHPYASGVVRQILFNGVFQGFGCDKGEMLCRQNCRLFGLLTKPVRRFCKLMLALRGGGIGIERFGQGNSVEPVRLGQIVSGTGPIAIKQGLLD